MNLKAIHRPKGVIQDSRLILNPFSGCSHNCWYCYIKRRYKRELPYQEPAKGASLKTIKNELEILQKNNDKTSVLISDFGDPYDCGRKPTITLFGEHWHIRSVLEEFRRYDHPFRILTKGGTRSIKDFDLYGPNDEFGCTLTCDNDTDSKKNEPEAALPEDRINALKKAHQRGIKTWVNFEPVLYPKQTLHLIELTYPFVSYYLVGKLNHFPLEEGKIDWLKFRRDAETLLESYEANYYLKPELEQATRWNYSKDKDQR